VSNNSSIVGCVFVAALPSNDRGVPQTHRQQGDRFQIKESGVKVPITTNDSKEHD
jgi:hypothetical protein